jgi:hypothetical protein
MSLKHPVPVPSGDDYVRVSAAIGEFLSKLTPHEREQIHNDLVEMDALSGLYPVSEMLAGAAGPLPESDETD